MYGAAHGMWQSEGRPLTRTSFVLSATAVTAMTTATATATVVTAEAAAAALWGEARPRKCFHPPTNLSKPFSHSVTPYGRCPGWKACF